MSHHLPKCEGFVWPILKTEQFGAFVCLTLHLGDALFEPHYVTGLPDSDFRDFPQSPVTNATAVSFLILTYSPLMTIFPISLYIV
jgi:hypothetical protein